jgi:hypothetical protein
MVGVLINTVPVSSMRFAAVKFARAFQSLIEIAQRDGLCVMAAVMPTIGAAACVFKE